MAVQVRCVCGRDLQAQDEFAGTPAQCPGCGRIYRLPSSPGETVDWRNTAEETCIVCGAGFSLERDLSPEKSPGGHYCHGMCVGQTPSSKGLKEKSPPARELNAYRPLTATGIH